MAILPAPPRETIKFGENTRIVLGLKGILLLITALVSIIGGYYALQYQINTLEHRIDIIDVKMK